MGMEVIKQGGEVVKDTLVIRDMVMGGGTGMTARLVVIPQRIGSAALYLDIAPMKLRDLQEQGCGRGGPEHTNVLWKYRVGQEGGEENTGETDSASGQGYRERLGPSTSVSVGGK